jgi:hypothetical protein
VWIVKTVLNAGVQVLHLPSEYDHPTLEDPSPSASGLDFNVHGDEEAPESLQGCALKPPSSMLTVARPVEDRLLAGSLRFVPSM